jgi:hypothetical protein
MSLSNSLRVADGSGERLEMAAIRLNSPPDQPLALAVKRLGLPLYWVRGGERHPESSPRRGAYRRTWRQAAVNSKVPTDRAASSTLSPCGLGETSNTSAVAMGGA